MTPETETSTKTLAQLRAEYVAAKAASVKFDADLEPEYEALKEQIEKLQAKFNADHRDAIMESARLGALASTADVDLRNAITGQYKAALALDPKTPKTLGEGMSVQVRTNIEYAEDVAVEWAEKNAPIMIRRTIDHKLFKAAVEKMKDRPQFVTVTFSISAVLKGF